MGDSRVYVGIDVYKELIEIDAISNIKAYKLERGNGGPGETIYLIVGNFGQGRLRQGKEAAAEREGRL